MSEDLALLEMHKYYPNIRRKKNVITSNHCTTMVMENDRSGAVL
jgi:hypothetical protein